MKRFLGLISMVLMAFAASAQEGPVPFNGLLLGHDGFSFVTGNQFFFGRKFIQTKLALFAG